MHLPLEARGNNFDSQIKIIYSWSKRIPFASSGPFCAYVCLCVRAGVRVCVCVCVCVKSSRGTSRRAALHISVCLVAICKCAVYIGALLRVYYFTHI